MRTIPENVLTWGDGERPICACGSSNRENIRAATEIQPVTNHPSYNPDVSNKIVKKPTPFSALFPVSAILQKLNHI